MRETLLLWVYGRNPANNIYKDVFWMFLILDVLYIVPELNATATVGTTRFAENFGVNCVNGGIVRSGVPP